MKVGSLFAGIGGFDLGFERAGYEIVWQVEIDPFCRRVLERHFPKADRSVTDVRQAGKHNLKSVDVICGGFPCQPFSQAGTRAGKSDNRYLWPEMLRIISALRPPYIVAENVYGLLSMRDGGILDEVYASLETQGYETIPPLVVPACAFGARHRRDRVFVVAHSLGAGLQNGRAQSNPSMGGGGEGRQAAAHQCPAPAESGAFSPNSSSRGMEGQRIPAKGRVQMADTDRRCASVAYSNGKPKIGAAIAWGEHDPWGIEPNVGRVAHGVPRRVDRLRGLGNAIVPQIAQWIAERIKAVDELRG